MATRGVVCGPGSLDATQELSRNAESRPYPGPTDSDLLLNKVPGDSYARRSMRSSDLEHSVEGGRLAREA